MLLAAGLPARELPFLVPFGDVELMGVGTPTFFALKADLSACRTTSVSTSGSGIDHEIVVIAACHDVATITAEDDLEFVEDAVVLVGVAQSWSEMIMFGDGFDGLTLHIDVPDLDSQVIAG